MRIIVGISGASGVIMGYELLKALKKVEKIQTELIITDGAKKNFFYETKLKIEDVEKVADIVHDNRNLAATISSGSYKTDGMIIIPCSMKTVAGIANGYSENLLLRVADVCIKENRKLIVVPREMPLSRIHLKNICMLAECGCTIIPPMLTFYNEDSSLEAQINHIIGKIFGQLGLDYEKFLAWNPIPSN